MSTEAVPRHHKYQPALTWQFSTGVLEAGYFYTAGATPDIQDSLIDFIRGRFQDTLATLVPVGRAGRFYEQAAFVARH